MIPVLPLEHLGKGSPLSEMGTVREEEVWLKVRTGLSWDIAVEVLPPPLEGHIGQAVGCLSLHFGGEAHAGGTVRRGEGAFKAMNPENIRGSREERKLGRVLAPIAGR